LKALAPYRIAIAPLGDFDPQLLETVSRQIHRVFGLHAEIKTVPMSLAFAYDAGRQQYHSTPILQKLAEDSAHDSLRVLALVEVDLFIPILTYVYGEAQIGGKACIVSTCRLNAGSGARYLSEKTAWRVVKESLHELGHTFSLRHCPDPVCLMHYCRGEADVDRKSGELCRYCRVMLDDELQRMAKSVAGDQIKST
jgi:archaemetzincin